MARGQRTNLAALAGAVGDNSPVEQSAPLLPAAEISAGLSDLTANPRNPRDDLGDLGDLASIAEIQLQPAVVVSQAAYLRLYPEDCVDTRWVVINGCRRLAAARKFGRADLEIVVKDEVARDRVTLLTAAISENVDRRGFDVLEEAKAVEALVVECGRGDVAAERLRKSPGWVSQRRALLTLAPELQSALRAGELAIREARSIARVPLEKQVAAWKAAQDRAAARDDASEEEASDAERSDVARFRGITKALRKFDTQPGLLATALRDCLGQDGVQMLLAELGSGRETTPIYRGKSGAAAAEKPR